MKTASVNPSPPIARKEQKKKRSFIPILGMTAEIGFLGYWTLSTASGGVPKTVGIIFGLLSSMGVTAAVRKSGNEKLNDWILGIALIGGMVAAAAADTLFG